MRNKKSFINFPVGNACNLRCKFCYNDSGRDKKQDFKDINELKEKLLDYSFHGIKTINLIGGEPLMYPKIFKLLDFLKDNNFVIKIVSNGVKLAEEKFMSNFLKYKNIISEINISFHSNNSYLEEKITSRKGIFEKKMLATNFLFNNKFKFTITIVINNYNVDYLLEIMIFFKNSFHANISLQGMLTYLSFSENNIKSIPNYTKIIEIFNDLGGKYNGNYYVHWIPLCIHFQINNIKYVIRELNRKFIFSLKRDGTNLLESRISENYIGDECKKCFALGKFCFGPGKNYVKKYGYGEFYSLNKEKVSLLIKISNKNNY